ASADALVHAGTKETFGLVILEAMACGRPVVAARAGAFPEFVDERGGVLAEPNSPFGMAAAMVALYHRELDTLGRAGRRTEPPASPAQREPGAGRRARASHSPEDPLRERHAPRRERAVERHGDVAVHMYRGSLDQPLARRAGDPILMCPHALDHRALEGFGKVG